MISAESEARAALVTTAEAAELLGVPMETVSEYVGAGVLGRIRTKSPRGGRMYLYAMEDLIAFDARFPRDETGRRSVKTRQRADRNITRRRCTDGRPRYTARVKYQHGPQRERSRTFATLEAARRWRDRMEAERDGTQSPETPEHMKRGESWWSRLTRRAARRSWEVAS